MSRFDPYNLVHKSQRARLFQLVVDAGRTDAADERAVASLRAAVQAMICELQAHAEHEERFIHPLLAQAAPAVEARLRQAHLLLDARLEELIGSAATAGSPEELQRLYRALARFTAAYLEHLACEEDEATPALWAACSDAELLPSIAGAFQQSRSATENLTSMLSQLPSANPTEAAAMLAVALGQTPRGEVSELLSALLPPRQLGALLEPSALSPS